MEVIIICYVGAFALYVGVAIASDKISRLPDEHRLRQWWHRNITHFDDMEED